MTSSIDAEAMSDRERETFFAVLDAAENWPIGGYVGSSWKTLQEDGLYQEPGLSITRVDETSFHQYAALAVYSSVLTKHNEQSPAPHLLRTSIDEVRKADRAKYTADPFPYDELRSGHARSLEPFTVGLLAAAARDPMDAMGRLGHTGIRHEWTVKPGRRLFVSIMRAIDQRRVPGTSGTFKEAACGPEGWSVKIERHGDLIEISREVGLLILGILGQEHLLYPIAATLVTIMLRRGLDLYCRPED
jgi:hypothetical protein